MSTTPPAAPKAQVEHWAAGLRPHLSATSRVRLDALIGLIDAEGWINYAAAYAELFPDSLGDAAAKTRADKAFNNFRRNLKAVADEQGLLFELRVDQRKKADPAKRRLWFVTADDSVRLRQVRVGNTFGDRTEVLAGLSEGERIALDPVAAGIYAKSKAVARHGE